VLRRIFGPKRVEMVGGWRELRIYELQNLYSSPNMIRIFISRHVVRMERRGMHIGFRWGNPERKITNNKA
jgi:hypothetical protein